MEKRGLVVLALFLLIFISSCEYSVQLSPEAQKYLDENPHLLSPEKASKTWCSGWIREGNCGTDQAINECGSPTHHFEKSYCAPGPIWSPGRGNGDIMEGAVRGIDLKVFEELAAARGKIVADYNGKFIVNKPIPGAQLVEVQRGIETRCVHDSLCVNTCTDGLDNDGDSFLDEDSEGNLHYTCDPDAQAVLQGPDGTVVQETGVLYSRDRDIPTVCHTRFHQDFETNWDYAGFSGGGRCGSESGYSSTMESPGWVDGKYYIEVANRGTYSWGWTNDVLCEGDGAISCYIENNSELHNEIISSGYQLTWPVGFGLVYDKFSFRGDGLCQGWPGDRQYVEVGDCGGLENCECNGDGCWQMNTPIWDYALVETYHSSSWIDGEGILQSDCYQGPLSCSSGDTYTEDCLQGDFIGDTQINWEATPLDGSGVNAACNYGTHTDTCVNNIYFRNWDSCTGSIPPNTENNCNDGIDNDCDGYADDNDVTSNGDLEFTADCGVCSNGDELSQSCGPPEAGVGICEYGTETQTCGYNGATWIYGDWLGCTAIFPEDESGEACNDGLDNDCDGHTDSADSDCGSCSSGQSETEACGATDVGLCEYGTHVRDCVFDDGSWGWEQWNHPETNAVDNPGTLSIDESCGDTYIAPALEVGVATQNAPCNDGFDNDCDGVSDSDEDGMNCGYCSTTNSPTNDEDCWYGDGLGECADIGSFSGDCVFVLDSGIWEYTTWPETEEDCDGATWPTSEICANGLDDDCDGEVDEDQDCGGFSTMGVFDPTSTWYPHGNENSIAVDSNNLPHITFSKQGEGTYDQRGLIYVYGVEDDSGDLGFDMNSAAPTNYFVSQIIDKTYQIQSGSSTTIYESGEESSLVIDGSDVSHVSYTAYNFELDPQNGVFGEEDYLIKYAYKIGNSSGNCGYDTSGNLEGSWNCITVSESGEHHRTPTTILVGSEVYVVYRYDTAKIRISKKAGNSFNVLGTYDVSGASSVEDVVAEYNSVESKINILYNYKQAGNSTNKIVNYIDFDVPSTSFGVNTQIQEAGKLQSTEIDLAVRPDTGDVHLVYPSYTTNYEANQIELNYKIKGANTNSFSNGPNITGTFGTGLTSTIEFDLNNRAHILTRSLDGSGNDYGLLYFRNLADNSWELLFPDVPYQMHGLAANMVLDSNNRAHLAYVYDGKSWDDGNDDFLKYSRMGV